MEIKLKKLNEIISRTSFAEDGDDWEKQYWPLFKERFPNCELFWRKFLVPYTKRIEIHDKRDGNRLYPRERVDDSLKEIGTFHYTTFLHLVYAYEHLMNMGVSSFEDFYIHLVSACDTAEQFLIKVHLLKLECEDGQSQFSKQLKKENFLYHKNKRREVLYEYYIESNCSGTTKGSRTLEKYIKFTDHVRTYRNVITHDMLIGHAIVAGKFKMVPKKEKIQDYKKFYKVIERWSNEKTKYKDISKFFIVMEEQMIIDIGTIEELFNKLWAKPIKDLERLFFKEHNEILLEKYNIQFVKAD